MRPRVCPPLAVCLAALLLLALPPISASPLARQQTPPDVEPDDVLLPDPPAPSPVPVPVPPPPAPGAGAGDGDGGAGDGGAGDGTGGDGTGGDGTGTGGDTGTGPGAPGETDGPDDAGVLPGFGPEDTTEPSPTPEIEGGDSNRGALVGGLVGGIFALLLLLLCLFCVFCWKKNDDEDQDAVVDDTGVYTSAAAGVDTNGGAAELPAPATPLDKDTARDMGPAAAALAAVPLAAAAAPSDEGSDGGGALVRGPTPPPHDYVLGAGPAATKKDFVDLRTKFERDEIGDNSAVLGAGTSAGVIGEGLESEKMADPYAADLPDAPASGMRATDTRGVAPGVAAASALPRDTESGVVAGVDIRPESLPDREGLPVPMTFDSQERLMAGGDGSGAISDAAMSLNAASIAEESGDVPSLERDPIEISRDRDTTF